MCEYPQRILPKKQYVDRIDINQLCSICKKTSLARRLDVETEPYHYIGNHKLVNEGVINNDVLDWSTNLLGGEFKIEDICWRQKGDGCAEWNNEDIDICDYNSECYEQTTSKYCAFITIECLHNIEIPYKRRFGSKKDVEQYAEKTQDITIDVIKAWNQDNEPECHATIVVEHKPTMLNYWHMTVGVIPRDFKEPISRDCKNSVKKRVKEALYLHIIKNITCDEPDIEEIPVKLYLKVKSDNNPTSVR